MYWYKKVYTLQANKSSSSSHTTKEIQVTTSLTRYVNIQTWQGGKIHSEKRVVEQGISRNCPQTKGWGRGEAEAWHNSSGRTSGIRNFKESRVIFPSGCKNLFCISLFCFLLCLTSLFLCFLSSSSFLLLFLSFPPFLFLLSVSVFILSILSSFCIILIPSSAPTVPLWNEDNNKYQYYDKK